MNIPSHNFDRLHDVVPGKHFYQFYKEPADLLRVLLPFWQEGVLKRNYCFWVAPDFLSIPEACAFLADGIPNLDELIRGGSFEMAAHADWYGSGETFEGDLIAGKYMGKVEEALRKGFSVIRIAGDNKVSHPGLWPLIHEYERKFQSQAASLPCIVLCSYRLHDLGLQQTKDVLDHHDGVLVARIF